MKKILKNFIILLNNGIAKNTKSRHLEKQSDERISVFLSEIKIEILLPINRDQNDIISRVIRDVHKYFFIWDCLATLNNSIPML